MRRLYGTGGDAGPAFRRGEARLARPGLPSPFSIRRTLDPTQEPLPVLVHDLAAEADFELHFLAALAIVKGIAARKDDECFFAVDQRIDVADGHGETVGRSEIALEAGALLWAELDVRGGHRLDILFLERRAVRLDHGTNGGVRRIGL